MYEEARDAPAARLGFTGILNWRDTVVRNSFSFALLFLMGCSLAHGQNVPELAQRTFPSVVMIVTSDANGQPLALGSGFVVGDGAIATNMHVIEGASAARVKVIGRPRTYAVDGIVGTDATADLALLKVTGLDAPPLQLGDSKEAAVGNQVFAVGNPEGLEGTFSGGIVSGIRTIGADELLQITAPISPGSSGGPVIDSAGRVLGIAVATFKEGQNLNFAVPVSYLKALMARSTAATPTPLAEIPSQSSSQSVVTQMGSASTVDITGGEFLWQDPKPLGDTCAYSFTLVNHLQQPVQNVYGILIFYGKDRTPLDSEEFTYDGQIPPTLGKRVTGQVDISVRRMTTEGYREWPWSNPLTPPTKVEFRILNFDIAQ